MGMGTCGCLASDVRLSQINPQRMIHLNMNGIDVLPITTARIKTNQEFNTSPRSNSRDKRHSDQTQDTLVKRSGLFLNFEARLNINVVVLGSNSVGKSAFVIRYITNHFEKLYIPSIANETQNKHVLFNNHPYDINFNVTARIDNDSGCNCNSVYEHADFFFILFDLTSSASFKQAKAIYKKEVIRYHNKFKAILDNVYLIANKTDLNERRIPQKDIDRFIEKYMLRYREISVKVRLNMTKVLHDIVFAFDGLAFPHRDDDLM